MRSAILPLLRSGLLACVLASALGGEAWGILQVDRIEVDLLARDDYRGDVAVTNDSSDEVVYVEVTVFEVLNAGTPDERRIEHKNPEEAGFLAAPRQLVLAPGQTKLVRMVAVEQPGAVDRIFRVQVRPVVGELVTEGMIVKVVVGYDMLVTVRPEGARPNIVGERQGNRLVLRNSGNSTGYLLGGKSCDAAGNSCVELPGKRMYPGNELAVELPNQGPAIYRMAVGLEQTELRF